MSPRTGALCTVVVAVVDTSGQHDIGLAIAMIQSCPAQRHLRSMYVLARSRAAPRHPKRIRGKPGEGGDVRAGGPAGGGGGPRRSEARVRTLEHLAGQAGEALTYLADVSAAAALDVIRRGHEKPPDWCPPPFRPSPFRPPGSRPCGSRALEPGGPTRHPHGAQSDALSVVELRARCRWRRSAPSLNRVATPGAMGTRSALHSCLHCTS